MEIFVSASFLETKMISMKDFVDSLPITANALSRNCGVKIVFQRGVTPRTDGETIFLPKLSEDSVFNRNSFLGTLIHECAHVRYSNLAELGSLSEAQHRATNAIEDLRIEELCCKEFAGAAYFLQEANMQALKKLSSLTMPDLMKYLLFCMLYVKANISVHFPLLVPQYKKVEKSMEYWFGSSLLSKAKELLNKEFKNLDSLKAAKKLAIKLLEIYLIHQKGKSSKRSSKASSSCSASSGSITQDSSVSARSITQDDWTSLDTSIATSNGKFAENPLDLSANLWTVTEQNQDTSLPRKPCRSNCLSQANNSSTVMENLSTMPKSDIGFLQNNLGVVHLLKRALLSVLQTDSIEKDFAGYRGRKLKPSSLTRLSTWDLRVFKSPVQRKSYQTIVHILMDRSGSLEKEQLRQEKIAAVALYDAVSQVPGAQAMLSVFPPVSRRGCRETIIPLGESSRKYLPWIAAINPFSFTPCLEAMTEVNLMFKEQKADKKILIVITDGNINGSSGFIEALKKQLKKDHVLFGAIGIDTEMNLPEFFEDNFSLIGDASDLPKAVLALGKKLIKD